MMIRRMKQWAAIVIMACMMAVVMPAQMLTAFAAGTNIAFSDPSAKVGSQIKVNMKVTSSSKLANVDIVLAYDSNSLEFVSGTNAEGGAGAVRVHGDGGTPGTGSMTFTMQFKALASGSSKITVTSQEIYDTNSKLVSVDHKGDSTVTVSALATASKDATLKSLKVSPGSLTPAFSPDVDTYAVTVGTDVDKLVISADTTDENATKVISGNEGLQMGENRVTCKVTAQDGETTKEYVIVVTKAEGGDSTASAPADTGQQVKMEITKRTITILPPDPSVKIPDGFKATTINIDGNKVQGWVWGADKDPQYCVVYGMNEAGEKNLYRYDMKDTERTLQRYFEDPVESGMVKPEQYNALASQYDKLRKDFNLYRILLVVTVAIAVVLLIILLVVLLSKKDKGGKPDRTDPYGSRGRGRSSSKRFPEEGYERRGKLDDQEGGPYDQEDYDQEYEDGYADPDDGKQTSRSKRGLPHRKGYEDEDGEIDGYRDEDDYGDEDGYRDENGYGSGDGYRDENGYGNRGGYRDGNGCGSEDGYRDGNGYGNEDGYRDGNGYGNEYGYRDGNGYGNGNGYRDEAGYGNADGYRDEDSYEEEDSYSGQDGYRDAGRHKDKNRDGYREPEGYREPRPQKQQPGPGSPAHPSKPGRPSSQDQDLEPDEYEDDFEVFDL